MAAAAATEAEATAEDDLGLPGWLNDLLKPGVGQGVFTTLKVSLLCLVLTLCMLLMYISDEVHARPACASFFVARARRPDGTRGACVQTARLHLSIFLGMAILLLILVVWFIGELQKAEAEEAKAGKKKE